MPRITVKVGTSTLAHPTGRINIRHIENLVKVLSDLKNAGNQIILVSSGAIGMGTGSLGLSGRPADMPTKQAAAAVGQCELMYIYDKLFSEYSHTVAQILLTADDLEHPDRRKNFENTLFRLLELNVLPILNENDTMATAEIAFGDNDSLAASVACCLRSDLLVMLTDTEGLYTDDPSVSPDAELIPCVTEITDDLYRLAKGSGSTVGTGGMLTKLNAAKACMACGIDTIICGGSRPELLYDIIEGKACGTKFIGKKV